MRKYCSGCSRLSRYRNQGPTSPATHGVPPPRWLAQRETTIPVEASKSGHFFLKATLAASAFFGLDLLDDKVYSRLRPPPQHCGPTTVAFPP